MANRSEYVVQLTVDKSGAVSNAQEFAGTLQGVDKSVTSLRGQLREMQKELSSLDPNSKAFQDLSKKAGDVKDKMNDAAEAVRANAGPAFESLGNNFGLLKGRLANLDFEGVSSSLKGIAGNIGGIKFSDLTNGVKAFGSSIATLGKALLTNPFFLIAGAVAALILNFDKIKEVIDLGVNPATRELIKTTDAAREAADNAVKSYDLEERRLRALGVAEEEIAEGRRKRLKEQIDASKAQLTAQFSLLQQQQKEAQANKRSTAESVAEAVTPIAGIVGAARSVKSLFGPSEDDIQATKDNLKKIEDEIKLFDVQILELDKRESDRKKGLIAQDEAAVDAGIKARQDASEKRKAISEKELQDDIAARKAASDAALAVFELQKKIQAQINDDRLKQQAEFLQSRTDQELKAIEDQDALRLELMAEGRDKEILLADEKYIALRDLAHGNAELLQQLAEENGRAVSDINDKYNKIDFENKKATEESKINLASQVIGSLGSIVDSFTAKSKKQAKAQFEITKGLNIAQAILNTYAAANSALATTLGGPIARGIAVAAVIGAGIANVNKIRQTKFDGGGSVDTSSGGGGSASSSVGGATQGNGVPAFNPLDTNFITNRPQQVQPAYVLAGQATTAIEAREKIARQANL